MNVLSLFDGISCAMIALERANIKVTKYYASEIDKNAIKCSEANYPNIIRLGDITNINGKNLDKIDLLLGGSPCQSFSNAGDRTGFNGKSILFYQYVRLLRETNPKYFLLENVKMKKEWADIISKELGVEPIEINSSLVSAQARKRLYWTNIPLANLNIQDKKLVIADVLGIITYKKEDKILMSKSEFDVKVRKHYINKTVLAYALKSAKRTSGLTNQQIASKLNKPVTLVEHWFRTDQSCAIPSDDIWFELKKLLNFCIDTFDKQIMEFEVKKATFDMSKRVYHINGKHPTLTTLTGGHQRATITDGQDMFYLTPQHAEKLQTLPSNYTSMLTRNQRFKVIGNGWTVDIIAEILKQIPQSAPGELNQ